MHLPQDSASLVHDSAGCPLAALIAQEPVEPDLEENGDSRQTLHADLPCEVQTAEPTSLQGTQSTESGSQESDTGLAESPPGESWGTATSISEETFTAGAAPQEEEPTNCDPRDIQSTDVTPWQPELSDLAPREPVSCHSPQETNSVSLARCETETEIEIVNLTGCQEPEAASLAPYEAAPQVPKTAYCIRPQGPEIANPAADDTADAGHRDTTAPVSETTAPAPALETTAPEVHEVGSKECPIIIPDGPRKRKRKITWASFGVTWQNARMQWPEIAAKWRASNDPELAAAATALR